MKKILFLMAIGIGFLVSFQSCSPYYYDRAYYPSRTVYVRPATPYYAPPPPAYYSRRPHSRWHRRGYRY